MELKEMRKIRELIVGGDRDAMAEVAAIDVFGGSCSCATAAVTVRVMRVPMMRAISSMTAKKIPTPTKDVGHALGEFALAPRTGDRTRPRDEC